MRSMKSVLGSSLMEEKTRIGPQSVSFANIIGLFIGHLKSVAETHLGQTIDRGVFGRPVFFVDGDEAADRAAAAALEASARRQGFKEIQFQYEPIAAALDYERTCTREELAIVVDVGGGTADFSVIRVSPGGVGRGFSHPGCIGFSRSSYRRHGLRSRLEPAIGDAPAGLSIANCRGFRLHASCGMFQITSSSSSRRGTRSINNTMPGILLQQSPLRERRSSRRNSRGLSKFLKTSKAMTSPIASRKQRSTSLLQKRHRQPFQLELKRAISRLRVTS